MYLYDLEIADVAGAPDDLGYWVSQDLISQGDDLNELIEHAEFIYIDQDGGQAGGRRADDVEEIITAWFISQWYKDICKPELGYVWQSESHYEKWCRENGYRPTRLQRFIKYLKSLN